MQVVLGGNPAIVRRIIDCRASVLFVVVSTCHNGQAWRLSAPQLYELGKPRVSLMRITPVDNFKMRSYIVF